MKRLILVVFGLAISNLAYADNHDVHGLWLTEAKDGHVEIKDCGDGTPCGTLVWVDPHTSETELDARNADETLRTRALIGVPIIWGFAKGKNNWRKGKIYNPEDGKTFSSSIRLLKDGTLKVKGCLGPICITNIWTAVSKNDEGL